MTHIELPDISTLAEFVINDISGVLCWAGADDMTWWSMTNVVNVNDINNVCSPLSGNNTTDQHWLTCDCLFGHIKIKSNLKALENMIVFLNVKLNSQAQGNDIKQ